MVIKQFILNTEDAYAGGENRPFSIIADGGAKFSMEVKNEDGYYYNFFNNTFQTNKIGLYDVTINNVYRGNISFPAVSDADQYDIYLWAVGDTEHTPIEEVRFDDGSLDINSTIGSNSKLVQKVIYQTLPINLTLSAVSINLLTAWGSVSVSDATIPTTVGKSSLKQPFEVKVTTAATRACKISKQPVANDIITAKSRTVGSAPENIEGENIYPTARAAFTGDDVNGAVTSGAVVRMDNTDLSAEIAVGDRVTTTATTDTVDGAITDGADIEKIVMDNNVASKMAVGDRITGTAELDAGGFYVRSLNPDGDNVKEFRIGTEDLGDKVIVDGIPDGTTLTFTSKLNRTTTTVTVVETGGVATDFTMSQAIALHDNAPLTFTPRKNFRWPLDNINGLTQGDKLHVTGNATAASITDYVDSTTLREGLEDEELIIHRQINALDTLGKKSTRTRNATTNLVTVTQPGNVVFSAQQAFALAGDSIKFYGYGTASAQIAGGWEVEFTDLKVELTDSTFISGTKPTTTTTGTVSNSTTIGVADREGIMQNVSTISGIGINPAVVNPTITSTQADGAGNWTSDVAQTLENGITLTIDNTSRFALITGNVEIKKAGTGSIELVFDLEKFLTAS
tara:strand:+ start:855 stop:2726 length:1872 start_codon:yes stop_codon:yes gene_type:complete